MKIGYKSIQQNTGKTITLKKQEPKISDKVVFGNTARSDDLLAADKLKSLQSKGPHYMPGNDMRNFEHDVIGGAMAFTAGAVAGGLVTATTGLAVPPWASMGIGGATGFLIYGAYKGLNN